MIQLTCDHDVPKVKVSDHFRWCICASAGAALGVRPSNDSRHLRVSSNTAVKHLESWLDLSSRLSQLLGWSIFRCICLWRLLRPLRSLRWRNGRKVETSHAANCLVNTYSFQQRQHAAVPFSPTLNSKYCQSDELGFLLAGPVCLSTTCILHQAN